MEALANRWEAQTRKAALYLDEIKPDWWQQVDPLKLDLVSHDKCICGQNDLNWMKIADAAGVEHKVFASATYFTGYWLEEIAQRMPAPDREQVPA